MRRSPAARHRLDNPSQPSCAPPAGFLPTTATIYFFNRDELRSRSIARPPTPTRIGDANTLLPIDPDGGGSWIGVNDSGWSFALLNYYQGQAPAGELVSRGAIVKGALQCRDIRELNDYTGQLPLQRHAPFSLLCLAPPHIDDRALPPEQQSPSNQILMIQWNGKQLRRQAQQSLITSSSRHFEDVLQARVASASRLASGDVDESRRRAHHRGFHHSHDDHNSALSVCMHRSDARTVSYSEITVRPGFAGFAYFAGSPCETETAIQHQMRW